jgi:hypothetical protein
MHLCKVSWFLLPHKIMKCLCTNASWHKTIMICNRTQKNMTDLCTKPHCINHLCTKPQCMTLSWFCFHSKIMIVLCTRPHCIIQPWRWCHSKIQTDLCTAASVHKTITDLLHTANYDIYLCTMHHCIHLSCPSLGAQHFHDFAVETKSWYIYARCLIA